MQVVCISGKRFTGKDTFADLITLAARRRGIALATYAFANEAKTMFAASRPEIDLTRLLQDRAYKEEVRPELTRFTTNALAADPIVFCREVVRRIEASGTHALITDLRLRLELEHLRVAFPSPPRVIRLLRSELARAASGWSYDAAKDTHFTETELDDSTLWNAVVVNEGTIADLAAVADELVNDLT